MSDSRIRHVIDHDLIFGDNPWIMREALFQTEFGEIGLFRIWPESEDKAKLHLIVKGAFASLYMREYETDDSAQAMHDLGILVDFAGAKPI